MSKSLEWQHSENMFGHTYHLTIGENSVLVRENLESNWLENQKKSRKSFWFRAPSVSLSELGTTLSFLSELDNTYFLEVFGDTSDKLNASLYLSDETDAATLAWTLTGTWMKWSKAEEKELKIRKPAKVKVGKNGKVTVKVQVTSLGD
jgi:hypothetical protein